MKADDWTFGTVLRQGRDHVMFLRWDRDRPTTSIYAAQWFVGIRITQGPTSFYPVGDTGRYQTWAWREAEEEVPA